MGENSNIGWTHNTMNFWLGCDKVAPECAHCYIDRVLRRQGREPWGQLYRTKTWADPLRWEKKAAAEELFYRVFTCSLSDFFHVKADAWRAEAWEIIRRTPHLVYLILTKRPELIEKRLPPGWPDEFPNVWLGVSTGCKRTLNKLDSLRRIPVHPEAVRFISAEPLLEDISSEINLAGFGWLITGGESGAGDETLYDPNGFWRDEFNTGGRRTMELEWAENLQIVAEKAKKPFYFKQKTAPKPGMGADALGRLYQEFPSAPLVPEGFLAGASMVGGSWAPISA